MWTVEESDALIFNLSHLQVSIPLSLEETQIPTCLCVGHNAPPTPARGCSLVLQWHKYGRPQHKHSGRHAAAAEAGWCATCCDGGRIWKEQTSLRTVKKNLMKDELIWKQSGNSIKTKQNR